MGSLMFIEQAIERLKTMPAPQRALGLGALARSLVHSNLLPEEYTLAEHALIRALDEPCQIARRCISTALADEEKAPRSLIHMLAHDMFVVAEPVLLRSPVLSASQLVEIIRTGPADAHMAIARRRPVGTAVSAALAAMAGEAACLALVRNPEAALLEETLRQIASRHAQNSELRDELLSWADLPIDVRHDLLACHARALKAMMADRHWIDPDRMERVVGDVTEKAVLGLTEDETPEAVRRLIRHLYDSDALTPQLLIRAAVTGNICVLEAALSLLSGQKPARVLGLLMHGGRGALKALMKKAGLGETVYPLIITALDGYRELARDSDLVEPGKLQRAMIENIMDRYMSETDAEAHNVLALLHRYAADAARDEARRATSGGRMLYIAA